MVGNTNICKSKIRNKHVISVFPYIPNACAFATAQPENEVQGVGSLLPIIILDKLGPRYPPQYTGYELKDRH